MEKDKVQSNDEISNKDLERVNVEPTALSDADLDNVAGGMTLHPSLNGAETNTLSTAGFTSKTYAVK